MIRFLLRRRMLLLYLVAFFFWGVFSAWPNRWLLNPSNWTKNHLVLLMNEAEARPCGGFVSAYGEVQIFPPKIALDNVYNLPEHDLGAAREPLTRVSNRLRFWDLGTKPSPEKCATDFTDAYYAIKNVQPDRVAMIDIGTLEAILAVIGPISFNGASIDEGNVFATLSRAVANTDRHDESSLANRKSSVGALAKNVLLQTGVRFWKWRSVSKLVAERIQSGQLYVSGITPFVDTTESWSLVEWNLGGAKSSRYLEKSLELFYRESSPGIWNITADVTVHHLGGFDAPLSQEYAGQLELIPPHFLESNTLQIPLALAPGETMKESFSYVFKGALPEQVQVGGGRNQSVSVTVFISAYPQQIITAPDMRVTDSVARWSGQVSTVTTLPFIITEDRTKPFVTLHQHIRQGDLPVQFKEELLNMFVAEIHFSEPVIIGPDFYAELLDKDHENAMVHQDLYLEKKIEINNRTLLLGFNTAGVFPNERYFLLLEGVKDMYGNALEMGQRTIIYRP